VRVGLDPARLKAYAEASAVLRPPNESGAVQRDQDGAAVHWQGVLMTKMSDARTRRTTRSVTPADDAVLHGATPRAPMMTRS